MNNHNLRIISTNYITLHLSVSALQPPDKCDSVIKGNFQSRLMFKYLIFRFVKETSEIWYHMINHLLYKFIGFMYNTTEYQAFKIQAFLQNSLPPMLIVCFYHKCIVNCWS